MEKIISLCKRRGFIFPGSDLYGGLANTYDYGPLGLELKNNIRQIWWNYFVKSRKDMVGIDGCVLLSPKVWEASGHIQKFKDSLTECLKCHRRFRFDKLKNKEECPECKGSLTNPRLFSGMFKTIIGPVEKEGLTAYLRPENAQNIFINFKNVLDSTNLKIPFGIAQAGKCFRNEITTGNFFFRTIEFEIMELEYFIHPSHWEEIFQQWLDYIYKFADILGLDRSKLFNNELEEKERAHYSKKTIDIEYQFPFGQEELWAIAYRGDFDLKRHQEFSKKDLRYFDQEKGERYLPHVIEPTFGLDRTVLAVLSEHYKEDKNRVVLKLPPQLAPVKVAIFPLLANKSELVTKARQVYNILIEELTVKKGWQVALDERGNIGKRYYSQDEIGTPFTLTIDFESLKSDDLTIRDRDTTKQQRVRVNSLVKILKEKLL